jgi:hypothetical protein
MKSILSSAYGLVVLALFLAPATSPAQVGRSSSPESRVAQLNQSIPLTPDQQAKVLAIYQTETEALGHVPADTRFIKTFELRQASRQQVRAVLTPEQQRKYEITPTGRGGGQTFYPENRMASLDREVGLTPQQKKVALEVFTEEAESLRALEPDDRPIKGREFREASRDQIRMLLTPDQQKKRDALRTAADTVMLEEKKFAEAALRASSAVTARVGSIALISSAGGQTQTTGDLRSGKSFFEVVGQKKTEKLAVFWEKSGPNAPYKLIKIESPDGGTLKP